MNDSSKSINKISRGMQVLFFITVIVLLYFLIRPFTGLYFRKQYNGSTLLHMSSEEIILTKGESKRLKILGINQRISFSSDDFKIAEVNIGGRITGHKTGTTLVRAKTRNKTYKCKVTVIDISKKECTLNIGKKTKLKVKGYHGSVKWKSDNQKIAAVSRFGKVEGIKEGKAVITASAAGKSLTCRITVLK